MRPSIVFTAALLAGCAGRPTPVAVVAPPPPVAVTVEAPPAPTPINAGLSPAGTLWHLRTGLNVAALACRGTDLTTGYNALLAREAVRLKDAEAAYAAEYAATGEGWRDRYDDEMTRLYNFWSRAGGRDALCAQAAAALADPTAVAHADATLATLDRGFAPPRLAVDPAIFGEPVVQLASR